MVQGRTEVKRQVGCGAAPYRSTVPKVQTYSIHGMVAVITMGKA